MFKKLSAIILSLAFVAAAIAPAQAQDTLGLYYAVGTNLERFGNVTGGVPFDIAAVAKTTNASNAAEFVMTDVKNEVASVFKLNTVRVAGSNLDLGNNNLGEYLIAYGTCVQAGEVELVRVTYLDGAGAIGADFVLQARGFQAGDTRPSSFGGSPGYVDCTPGAGAKFPMTLEPWVDFDTHNPLDQPGGAITSADGVCVLNADVIPTTDASMGALKARF